MVAMAIEKTNQESTRNTIPMVTKTIRNKKQDADRPAIQPLKNYTRREAARIVPCAVITLIRAYDAGHLSAYRVGRNVVHSGQHLIAWLEAGGRTGRVGNQMGAVFA